MLPCTSKPLTCNATEWAQMQAYGSSFMTQFGPYEAVPASPNGAFLDACLVHGSTTSTIDGLTNSQAFESWLAGNKTHGNWWNSERGGAPRELAVRSWATAASRPSPCAVLCNGSDTAGPCDRGSNCEPFPAGY